MATFLFRRESELLRVETELRAGTWRPGGFHRLFLRDPKPRVITRAPVHDRVVHTAVGRLLERVYAPLLDDGDFACRDGRGTHRALLRLLELVRRFPFAMHLDLRSYFPSIRIDVVERELSLRIRDPWFLTVMRTILESGRGLYDDPRARRFARMDDDWPPRGEGLPIGAYTSQVIAAHVVPLRIDRFVKRVLRIPGYVRYVDDLFLFDRSRRALLAAREGVAGFVGDELALRLKRPDAPVLSTTQAVHGLGWSIRREGLRTLPRRRQRLRQGVAELLLDRRLPAIEPRIAGLLADEVCGLSR